MPVEIGNIRFMSAITVADTYNDQFVISGADLLMIESGCSTRKSTCVLEIL
jgi:hypothetical protein